MLLAAWSARPRSTSSSAQHLPQVHAQLKPAPPLPMSLLVAGGVARCACGKVPDQFKCAVAEGRRPQLPQALLLRKSAAFVTRILSVLGIVEPPSDHPGFGAGGVSRSSGSAEASAREGAVLNLVTRTRDDLRSIAKAQPAAAEPLMALSDRCKTCSSSP